SIGNSDAAGDELFPGPKTAEFDVVRVGRGNVFYIEFIEIPKLGDEIRFPFTACLVEHVEISRPQQARCVLRTFTWQLDVGYAATGARWQVQGLPVRTHLVEVGARHRVAQREDRQSLLFTERAGCGSWLGHHDIPCC